MKYLVKFGLFLHGDLSFEETKDTKNLFNYVCYVLIRLVEQESSMNKQVDMQRLIADAVESEKLRDMSMSNPVHRATLDIKNRLLNKRDWLQIYDISQT